MYKVKISRKDLYSFKYQKREVISMKDTEAKDLSKQEIEVIAEMLDKILSIKNNLEGSCNEAL